MFNFDVRKINMVHRFIMLIILIIALCIDFYFKIDIKVGIIYVSIYRILLFLMFILNLYAYFSNKESDYTSSRNLNLLKAVSIASVLCFIWSLRPLI